MNHVRLAISAATLSFAALAGASVAIPAHAQQQPAAAPPQTAPETVANTLTNDPRFATTIKMIYVAGAAGRLQTANNLTVFAATDDGWSSSPSQGMLSSLTSTGAGSEFPDSMGILQVLRGFFVHGEPPANPPADVKLQSVAGRPIDLDEKDMKVSWVAPDGEARSAPLGKPILASNGIIYPVDAVVGE